MSKWKIALISVLTITLLMSATALFISLNPSPETPPPENSEIVPEEIPEVPSTPKNEFHFRVWAIMDRDTLKSFRDNGGWEWYKSATIEVNVENLGNCNINKIFLIYTTFNEANDTEYLEYFVGDLLIGQTKTFVFTDCYIYWRPLLVAPTIVNSPIEFRCDEFPDGVDIILDWGNWHDEILWRSGDFEFEYYDGYRD